MKETRPLEQTSKRTGEILPFAGVARTVYTTRLVRVCVSSCSQSMRRDEILLLYRTLFSFLAYDECPRSNRSQMQPGG